MVSERGRDWVVVSKECKLKLPIDCRRLPCQENAAVVCTSSVSSCSASVHVSANMADKAMINGQSSASQPCSKATSTFADVDTTSTVVSSTQDVTVTSSVIR